MMMVVLVFAPMGTAATIGETVQPYASSYLTSYNAYVYPAGGGLVQVYFSAHGTGYIDELGALTIQIYECSTNSSNINDWEWKTTFRYDTTAGMLSYNDNYHSGHVDYEDGVAGMYYKAYVCIWGGDNGDGDSRYFWTSAKKAT